MCAPASVTRFRRGPRRSHRRETAYFGRVDPPHPSALVSRPGDKNAPGERRQRGALGRNRARGRAIGARRHRHPPSVEDLRAGRRRRRAFRHRMHGRGRRIPLDRRALGLRQIDLAENTRGAALAHQRRGTSQRLADRRAAQGYRRGVPVSGAVSLAQRTRQCVVAGRRAAARPREDETACARFACAGRADRIRASLSVGVVRRHAAARRAGARADP